RIRLRNPRSRPMQGFAGVEEDRLLSFGGREHLHLPLDPPRPPLTVVDRPWREIQQRSTFPRLRLRQPLPRTPLRKPLTHRPALESHLHRSIKTVIGVEINDRGLHFHRHTPNGPTDAFPERESVSPEHLT